MPEPQLDAAMAAARKAADCGECRLWPRCGGTRALDGDPYPEGHRFAGKPRWRTPTRLPSGMPEGEHAEDRRISECPERAIEPWMWGALNLWAASQQTGLPPVPDLETADPRTVRACQILDTESRLIGMKDAEDAKRRARLTGGRRG